MTIVAISVKVLLVLLSIPAAYLFISTIAAYFFRKKSGQANRFLNIGVLISAHNEEDGIQQTIMNVRECDYPANRLDIFVIADNCSDQTAERARHAGAVVAERTDPAHRGKGQALDWFLRHHRDMYHHTDVITIIDADVAPEKNYLIEISQSLSQDNTKVVQAYNGVSNPEAGWRPALIDAAFNVFNHLRMAGAVKLSGSSVLKGNGMAFRTELLEKYGWPCHSIVEDMEFSLLLLQDGITVDYNSDAVIRSEMVTSGKNASSQRSRWEGGRFTLVRTMTIPLLRLFRTSLDPRYLFALAELIIPPLSMLVILFVLMTPPALLLTDGLWMMLPGAWLAILLLYVISGQIQRRAPLRTWLVLAVSPIYILWKIPLYIAMALGKKSSAWIRTSREKH